MLTARCSQRRISCYSALTQLTRDAGQPPDVADCTQPVCARQRLMESETDHHICSPDANTTHLHSPLTCCCSCHPQGGYAGPRSFIQHAFPLGVLRGALILPLSLLLYLLLPRP